MFGVCRPIMDSYCMKSILRLKYEKIQVFIDPAEYVCAMILLNFFHCSSLIVNIRYYVRKHMKRPTSPLLIGVFDFTWTG